MPCDASPRPRARSVRCCATAPAAAACAANASSSSRTMWSTCAVSSAILCASAAVELGAVQFQVRWLPALERGKRHHAAVRCHSSSNLTCLAFRRRKLRGIAPRMLPLTRGCRKQTASKRDSRGVGKRFSTPFRNCERDRKKPLATQAPRLAYGGSPRRRPGLLTAASLCRVYACASENYHLARDRGMLPLLQGCSSSSTPPPSPSHGHEDRGILEPPRVGEKKKQN